MIGAIYFLYASKPQKIKSVMAEYWSDAMRSAASLKKHMPYITIDLYSNFQIDPVDCFDRILSNEPDPGDIWQFKYQCLLKSTYDITLHLDADTFICDDFSEVFRTMDRFDLAFTLSMTYVSQHTPDIPLCFPEPAGGFMVFKNNETVRDFLIQTQSHVVNRRHGCDEPCLRRALYETDIRYAVLPWEYNCLYIHPGYACMKIKVMHGPRETIQADADIMNTKIYKRYDTWKRIFTGDRLLLFKKKRQKIMEVVKEIPYQKNGFIRA